MTKILLLEDDLSLINGLSFAFKKQGYELDIAKTLKEAGELWMANTIYWFWMFPFLMAQVLNSVRKSEMHLTIQKKVRLSR